MNKLINHNINFLIQLVFLFAFIPNAYSAITQEVTILADDSYPPYSYIENGKAKGLYVDIVKEASKFLAPQFKINIIASPWKRALSEIKKGSAFALIPPYKHIKERPYIWPYSVQIIKEEVVAFCNKNVKLSDHINKVTSPLEHPLFIGINAGYLVLNENLKQAKEEDRIVISENKSTQANIMKLYTKRIDCYINDKYSINYELSKMKKERAINFDNIKQGLLIMVKTGHIGYTNAPMHSYPFKEDFVFRMDEALLRLKSTNQYQKIMNSYNVQQPGEMSLP